MNSSLSTAEPWLHAERHGKATDCNSRPENLTSVPERIDQIAAQTPQASAVVSSEGTLTYHELATQANRLASSLTESGAGADHPVAICLDRSPRLLIAQLAAMKAGAAYVPLDPALPPKRIEALVAECGAALLIGEPQNDLALADGTRALSFRDLLSPARARGAIDPLRAPALDSTAYVIFTSGSTGKPKGVMISHRNLLNLVRWHSRAFGIGPDDRGSHLAGLGFDAAVWETWPYLAVGAAVYLPGEDVRRAPRLLRDWMVTERITVGFAPTAIAEQLISLDWPPETPLRFLLTGADVLTHYPAAHLPFAFVNNYGPTECTVVSTSGQVRAEDGLSGPPSIGKPIDGTEIYLLDQNMQPVAPGVVGEIYIGGESVGIGYLNMPEATAKSFLPDPFTSKPGARVYKTGDEGKLLLDGSIAFLGRIDDQIKIRGYRIEPSEIMTALRTHPDVRHSHVLSHMSPSGDKVLVCYFVSGGANSADGRTLQQFLAERLPEYMVPTIFIEIDEVPLTPNGKVDRAALPSPDLSANSKEASSPEDGGVHPEIERQLSAIVMKLLQVKTVQPDDNIFLLGGHSLLGIQLIARIRDAFGVELTLFSVFESPTVRTLGAEIEQLILAKIESLSVEDSDQMAAVNGQSKGGT